MVKAFAYLRVSGKGASFTKQLEAIKKYAARNGIKITKVYREDGVSGTTDWSNRPAFSEMMTALFAGGTRTILVERLDRCAKDLIVQETIIADFKREALTIMSVKEPDLCSEDPNRVQMRKILGALVQYEKTFLAAKLIGTRLKIRASTGACEGRKPYGARRGEPTIIGRIQELRAEGMGYDAVATTLNAEGVEPRSGSQWHGSTVRNVVLRAEREGR